MSLGGACALLVLWLWARYSDGVRSLNYVGTTVVGEHCPGGVITKWISFGYPLIPVRSYILVTPTADGEAFDFVATRTHAHDIADTFSAIPLPGLGIDWAAVGKTYVTALAVAIVIGVISFILVWLKHAF